MAPKILIIRLSSIGDIIHSSAIPRNLKKHFKDSQIHWLVRSDNLELVANNPYVTRSISFDRKLGLTGWIRLAQELKRENYTHIYDAHNNLRSHILCSLLKAPNFARRSKERWKRFLLFKFKKNKFGEDFKTVDSYVEPLKVWGVVNDKLGPELHLNQKVKDRVEALFKGGPNWVALAPFTAWDKKTWPLDYWKKLVSDILEKTEFKILILGGPGDNDAQKLLVDNKTISLQGQLSLLESAYAASLCKTLIIADTGLLHMTECLQKDVLGLIGPTPFGFPYRSTSRYLKANLKCQPCTKDGSGACLNLEYKKCMKEIKPSLVFKTFQEMVE